MDINSLLSPQDSPAPETPPPPPRQSPMKRSHRQPPPRRTSSNLSQQYTPSPVPQIYEPVPLQSQSLPHNQYHTHLVAHSPGLGLTSAPGVNENGRARHSAASTPPGNTQSFDSRMTPPQPPIARQTSTPGMDTLADLASMRHQQQQAVKHSAGSLRNSEQRYQPSRPPMTLENLPRTLSGGSAKDLQMATQDATPRVFKSSLLSETECEKLTEAFDTRLKDATNYNNNKLYVELLYQAFERHCQDGEPATFEFLSDLLSAFDQISRIYSLGEDFYLRWLELKLSLVRSTQDRLDLMLFCKDQVLKDERCSVKLWMKYGGLIYEWYIAANDPASGWSNQEKVEGSQIFTWSEVETTWKVAEEATRHRLNDCHEVFLRWMDIRIAKFDESPTIDEATSLMHVFEDRLTLAHAKWEQTRDAYSKFLDGLYSNDRDAYYAKMDALHDDKTNFGRARAAYKFRQKFENSLLVVSDENEGMATQDEYSIWIKYIFHEMKKEGVFSFNAIVALFERALLRFPVEATLWLDYVEYLIKKSTPALALEVLDRAVRHAPWSGPLWAHKILMLEITNHGRKVIDHVKNEALKTGALYIGNMEDLVQLFVAFCGFLRRQAFNNTGGVHQHAAHGDPEIDEAELAIADAIEHVNKIGEQCYAKYNEPYPGDPQFRLEKIKIKLLTQQDRIADARNEWNKLQEGHSDQIDYYLRRYTWELVMWPVPNGPNFGMLTSQPSQATAALADALARLETIDHPEQAITMYLQHCEQHENATVVQSAMIACREASKMVTERRQREAAAYQQAAATATSEAMEVEQAPVPEASTAPPKKRKRSDSVPKNEPETLDDVPLPRKDAPLTRKELARALDEGRQIFVQNVPFNVALPALAAVLSLPPTCVNLKKGVAFGTFPSPAEAQAAVTRLDGSTALGRPLGVELATKGGREKAAAGKKEKEEGKKGRAFGAGKPRRGGRGGLL